MKRAIAGIVAALVACGPAFADEPPPSTTLRPARLEGRIVYDESDVERQIRETLDGPNRLSTVGETFGELIGLLREKHDLSVALEQEWLADDPINANPRDANLTAWLAAAPTVTLRQTLSVALRRQELKHYVRNDRLYIAASYIANPWLGQTTRLYQVDDLVIAPNDPASVERDLSALVQAAGVCAGDSDHVVSSAGIVRGFLGPGILALVVRHDEEGHQAVERLLVGLRQARRPALAAVQAQRYAATTPTAAYRLPRAPPPTGRFAAVLSDDERQLRELLDEPIALQFRQTRLGDVARLIELRRPLSIAFDAGVFRPNVMSSPMLPITLDFREGSLHGALQQMLRPYRLQYVVRGKQLLITSQEAAVDPSRWFVRAYPVDDLVMSLDEPAAASVDCAPLVDLLTSLIRFRNRVGDGGGVFWAVPMRFAGTTSLLICHDEQGYHEVERLFRLLRRARDPEIEKAQSRSPTPVAAKGGGVL